MLLYANENPWIIMSWILMARRQNIKRSWLNKWSICIMVFWNKCVYPQIHKLKPQLPMWWYLGGSHEGRVLTMGSDSLKEEEKSGLSPVL